MDKGEFPIVAQRQQTDERRVQPESIVKRQGSLIHSGAPDRDRRAGLVIATLDIGHDDTQPINGTTQKNHDQPLGAAFGGCCPSRGAEWQQAHPARQSEEIAPVHRRPYPTTKRSRPASSSVVSAVILIHLSDQIEMGANLCLFRSRAASVAPADRAGVFGSSSNRTRGDRGGWGAGCRGCSRPGLPRYVGRL